MLEIGQCATTSSIAGSQKTRMTKTDPLSDLRPLLPKNHKGVECYGVYPLTDARGPLSLNITEETNDSVLSILRLYTRAFIAKHQKGEGLSTNRRN